MSIWKKPICLQAITKIRESTLAEFLDIKIIDFGENYLTASMPVNARTHQPMGILHGGASIALAETVGSVAANLAVDDQHYCVGLEVNGNHLKSVKSGLVYATALPIHLGRTTQVWEIKIKNEADQNICFSRLTMAVLEKK